ncbi:MAG TPA: CaiB/BaiF CoA-transferase family protein [Microthrixaceae bacterium]|nr:CaiB/BaiF CoA-transferase family protein [Microthrixaceae bacterium]
MEQVLEGVRVLEVSAWAFVPSAGAVLADWGAEVVKVEPPDGDPMRGLISGGVTAGPSFPWEVWNRGKHSIGIDLRNPEGRELVLKLAESADVFLTSYLPATRQKLGIDITDVQARNENIVYACGSGHGPLGDDANRGGYDAISFWARGGIAAGSTPPDAARPVNQPSGAFGDSLSGMALAGGVAAALLRRERSGVGAVVDVSLLGTAMWAMQMSIVGASVMVAAFAKGEAPALPAAVLANPLVNTYRTADDRWISLCMLQRDVYWDGFFESIGRSELSTDPRFADAAARTEHTTDAVAELEATFATRPLAEWRVALATQPGQWDVVSNVLELPADPQAVANHYVQQVGYGETELPLVASPAQIDRTAPALRHAPEFNDHADELLTRLGLTEEQILELRISGALV